MRVHNFGAGPCTLPLAVLEEAQGEFLDFQGSGMSVVELSHRSATYDAVHRRCIELARSVSEAPEDFEVLLIQGGATMQFSMVPMNLLGDDDGAGYVVAGTWGKKAHATAATVGSAYKAYDGADNGFTRMPAPDEIRVLAGTRYLHVTSNETIGGIRLTYTPRIDVPLVADMSSDFLARPIEWDRYDLVYGGVQKNLGPSGMALVFARKSAIAEPVRPLGDYLRYGFHAETDSLGNTPAMFSTYIMGKVLERLAAAGGVPALERESAEKAHLLYDAIDESGGYYRSPVNQADRSHTNVVFRLLSEDLEKQFVAEATSAGLIGLKGHRSVGGCRASLYAALERASVERLVEFMEDFARANR